MALAMALMRFEMAAAAQEEVNSTGVKPRSFTLSNRHHPLPPSQPDTDLKHYNIVIINRTLCFIGKALAI